MGASVSASKGASQSQTVDRKDRKSCALDAVNSAIAESGECVSSIAAHMACSESYVSRVRNGETNLSIWFILKLPVPVKKLLAKFWFEYYGGVGEYADTDEKTALRHMVGALLKFRMLKMALPEEEKERVG